MDLVSAIDSLTADSIDWVKVNCSSAEEADQIRINTIMRTNGIVICLTGLSGAGKTTIAMSLKKLLLDRQINVEVLDGDIIRSNLSKDLTYSKEDRATHIRRVGFIANLLSQHGVIVIIAAISPDGSVRNEIKAMTKSFLEVYVNASLEVCESRDPKGLYAAARAGKIKDFTGIDAAYEAPLSPDIICFTERENVEESVLKIYKILGDRNLLYDVIGSEMAFRNTKIPQDN